jgi:hypothetical protein
VETEISGVGIGIVFSGGKDTIEYNEWIQRERKIRIKLLKDSPVIRHKKTFSVCQNCGEICLCHEETCPNCNSDSIVQKKIDDAEMTSGELIRCRFRFEHLA